MKKIIFYIFILLIPVILSISCAGYMASPYSSVGVGISGGPYGVRFTPTVNVGIYSGGWR